LGLEKRRGKQSLDPKISGEGGRKGEKKSWPAGEKKTRNHKRHGGAPPKQSRVGDGVRKDLFKEKKKNCTSQDEINLKKRLVKKGGISTSTNHTAVGSNPDPR